ncbi:MAG: HalD/BesD family halogenase [Spirillospora sp.]
MGAAEALDRMVDTARYPLTEPGGTGWNGVVSRTRDELAKSGCCVLPDFIRAPMRDVLRTECAEIAPHAHYDVETVNAYNIDVRTPLPEDHPGRITVERGNAFVARDHIPAASIVHLLYSSGHFQRFVADCFGLPRVHELADPLSGLCLNVVNPGMEHPWHFDTNEFTVSLLTQESEDGGVFEYCPNIRSAGSENFGDVRRVLAGRGGDLVQRLTLRPGDLQLFKGRYALHRVAAVTGTTPRHTAIFAYSERPGVVGSVARTRQLFGRVLPEHLAAEGRAVRVDRLLD